MPHKTSVAGTRVTKKWQGCYCKTKYNSYHYNSCCIP